MKYLLPCSCGKSVAVEVSQAGQSVRCPCGNTLDVPAMRLIRQLPPAVRRTSTNAMRDRPWSLHAASALRRGLAVLVGGLGTAGFFQVGRADLETEEVPWDNLERSHQDIDQMNIGADLGTLDSSAGPIPSAPTTLPYSSGIEFLSADWLRDRRRQPGRGSRRTCRDVVRVSSSAPEPNPRRAEPDRDQ